MSDVIREVLSESPRVEIYCADCLDILPTLAPGSVDAVVTDPPYGMGKADWDLRIPDWLHLIDGLPSAVFCGVVGLRDYPTPDWVGAWVRLASTQRIGKLRGFNNWEPILFYSIEKLDNDVISVSNTHDENGHPTVKPLMLMTRLVQKMPGAIVLDPFMGSGTTGVAAVKLGRGFIGIEKEKRYYDIARRRILEALAQPALLQVTA